MLALEAMEALVRVVETRGLQVLLIGALAREIVFDQLNEGRPYRATWVVVVSVRVSDWDEYHNLIDALVEVGFTREGEHKLRYSDGTELDLLPYGGVADENNAVPWMGGDRVMSVDGFEAAAAHGEMRDVSGVQIRVANLPSLIALKFFALRDRIRDLGATDLLDLTYILTNASSALGDRIYEDLEPDLQVELGYQELGPRLLGRDVATTVKQEEVVHLLNIIDKCVLTTPDYAALSRVAGTGGIDTAVACMESFRQGLAES